ncbi:hypothetical protein [Streptomyces sp. NPDC051546]|uniref:hypothetical protein n=1 Tax=Streptomyces sp. NPDC051546 TaxID=3365655 RepID=UPI0037943F7F
MTIAHYKPDPARPHLVPLGIDQNSSEPVFWDWETTPHLAIVAGAGYGTTSLIRLIAAHTVAIGGTATVIDCTTAEYEEFLGIQGLDVAYELDEIQEAIRSHLEDIADRIRATANDPTSTALPRVLAIDGLGTLWHHATDIQDHSLLWALTDIRRILATGRAANIHLVTDLDAATTIQNLSADELRGAAGTVVLGGADPDLARVLGTNPPSARLQPGTGIWRTPADTGRPINLARLTEEAARALALGALQH